MLVLVPSIRWETVRDGALPTGRVSASCGRYHNRVGTRENDFANLATTFAGSAVEVVIRETAKDAKRNPQKVAEEARSGRRTLFVCRRQGRLHR